MTSGAFNHKYFQLIVFIPSLFFLAFNADAKKKKYLRAGRQEVLESTGIRFKGIKGAKPAPLPRIARYPFTWKNSQGKIIKKIELYLPRELWLHAQCLGRWAGESGSLTVLKMTVPPLEGLKKTPVTRGYDKETEYVKKEDYDKWLKSASAKWDKEKVAKWLELLAEGKVDSTPKNISKGRINIDEYTTSVSGAFLFLVSNSNTPGSHFVLFYKLAPLAEIEKSRKGILQSVKSIAFFVPKNDKSKQKITRKSIKKKDRTPEYIASREQVIQNIKNLDDWWFLETMNYIFVANIKKKKMINDIQSQIERCRSIYEKAYPQKKPLKAVSVVKVFQERDEYVKYLGEERGKRTVGLWASFRKELVVSPREGGKKGQGKMLRTLYHEGFHQYIYYMTDEKNVPPWFNEGHATLFEGIKFKGRGKFEIGMAPRRIRRFMSMGKTTSASAISDLLKMGYDKFYEKDTSSRNYTLAWALTYFLNKGAPVMKEKNNYSDIPVKYIESLCVSKDGNNATESVWKNIDMDKFVNDFNKFWSNKKLIKKSLKYDFIKAREMEKEKK